MKVFQFDFCKGIDIAMALAAKLALLLLLIYLSGIVRIASY